jgi:16S rRNA (guanine966-N2)-methyltransferase
MISISGGQWRGRKIKAIDRPGLRPTSSRVKASIFSILEALVWKRTGRPDFTEWRCLDLFAGVGGLGLEMLSRGAATCVFVEKDRVHARVLQENIASLGCAAQARVLVEDVERGGWEALGPFDLILLDPPYARSELPALLARFGRGPALRDGGIVLFEHDPALEPVRDAPGLLLHSHRTLGPAGISVYVREPG